MEWGRGKVLTTQNVCRGCRARDLHVVLPDESNACSRMHACTHCVCMYVCMYVFMYACMNAKVHVQNKYVPG